MNLYKNFNKSKDLDNYDLLHKNPKFLWDEFYPHDIGCNITSLNPNIEVEKIIAKDDASSLEYASM